MNEHDDEIDLVTEERLRRAVRFRDAEVTTSPDALSRIARRADTLATPRWRRPVTVVGVAAAAVALVAGLVVAFQAGDDDAPDVATEGADDADDPASDTGDETSDDTVSPSSTLLPSTSSTAPTTTTVPGLPDLTPRARAELGLVVWPLDSRSFEGATNVAYSYATQALGVDDPVLETECCEGGVGTVSIAQRGEDGEPFGQATRLDVVALDEFNWVVVRASSDEVQLSSVTVTGEGLATVTGSGRSFEGAARVVARSLCDPEGVITPVTVGGGPEFADFEHSAAFVSCPDAPIVFELATEGALATDVPFVSAVAYAGPIADVGWSVMRVGSDDVLNVRSGPGVDNDIVATLTPDATGVRLLDESAEAADGATWVEIATPDGVEGWVNFAYLTAQAGLDDVEAEGRAFDALDVLAAPPGEDPGIFSPRGLYVGGIGVYADAPTPFVHVDRATLDSDELVDWNPFPTEDECGAECQMTVREFLDVGSWRYESDATVEIDALDDVSIEDQFLYGPTTELELFDSLHSVTFEIPATSEGDLDWRRYHLWFDWADGQAHVIAIWRWGWTP